MAILNPVAWSWEHLRQSTASLSGSRPEEYWPGQVASDTGPHIRHIGTRALRNALADGWDDFAANRTDLIMMALIYPALGLLLSRLAWGHDMLPLIFPLASGFALIGPFAAIGLMEMSRQREIERPMPWSASFSVFRSPALGSILLLGLMLVGLLGLWLAAAGEIYANTVGTLGPAGLGPDGLAAFLDATFRTPEGWTMIVLGMAVGMVFAIISFCLSVVSFPLLLDRKLRVSDAIVTSFRAVAANPVPMLLWGMMVAALLVLGSIPLLLGLAVVVPWLGHSTWHLYRRLVQP